MKRRTAILAALSAVRPPCPHCGETRTAPHHLLDAGELDPEHAIRLGYCPVLAERRNRIPA